jgi:hypothetical protein
MVSNIGIVWEKCMVATNATHEAINFKSTPKSSKSPSLWKGELATNYISKH